MEEKFSSQLERLSGRYGNLEYFDKELLVLLLLESQRREEWEQKVESKFYRFTGETL